MANDAELSRQYQEAAAAISTGHLDEAAWLRLSEQALPEDAIDHLVRCGSCAAMNSFASVSGR